MRDFYWFKRIMACLLCVVVGTFFMFASFEVQTAWFGYVLAGAGLVTCGCGLIQGLKWL